MRKTPEERQQAIIDGKARRKIRAELMPEFFLCNNRGSLSLRAGNPGDLEVTVLGDHGAWWLISLTSDLLAFADLIAALVARYNYTVDQVNRKTATVSLGRLLVASADSAATETEPSV